MIIFVSDRLAPRAGIFGAHGLWHLCVLAGSACRVWGVARYLTLLA